MSNTITATFKNSNQAREAIFSLETSGITEEQVSVITTDETAGNTFNIETSNKAAEGGLIGGSLGGLIGAITTGLAASGAVAIPGVNLVVFGSVIAAAAGAGVGAVSGGLVGSLIGLGIPEYEAKKYEDEIKDGAVLILVEAENKDQKEMVEKIFEQTNATKIAA